MTYITDTQVEQACDVLRKAINAAENSNHAGEVFVVAAANATALVEALEAADALIAFMTNQMQQFVEPSGYTAFDRKRIAFGHDREAKESLFIGDMIYLLDGPEQRDACAKINRALTLAKGGRA